MIKTNMIDDIKHIFSIKDDKIVHIEYFKKHATYSAGIIKIDNNKKYYKLLGKDMINHGFKYQTGLNIDTNEFNRYLHTLDDKFFIGGLSFTGLYLAAFLLEKYEYLAEVQIPKDAIVADEDVNFLHTFPTYRTDKLIIEKVIPIDIYCLDYIIDSIKEPYNEKPMSYNIFRALVLNKRLELAKELYNKHSFPYTSINLYS